MLKKYELNPAIQLEYSKDNQQNFRNYSNQNDKRNGSPFIPSCCVAILHSTIIQLVYKSLAENMSKNLKLPKVQHT